MRKGYRYFLVILLGFLAVRILAAPSLIAGDADRSRDKEEEFDATTFIMGHMADSHEWHLFTTGNGRHVSVYLPVILIDRESGLHIFSSRKISGRQSYKGFAVAQEGDNAGKIIRVNGEGLPDGSKPPLDFSITRTIFGMLVASLIMLWLMVALARSYKKSGISAPRGIQGFLEPVVVFIRDEVALPNIGEKKHERFMPYLLTVFFFILINNLLGLIPVFPFGANVTGNINVTFVLAAFTLVITQFSANKSHWRHVFAAPGVPLWLLPVMIPIEIIGLFSKPFALMVRLFANITAGHIIVMSLVSLIFIFKSILVSPAVIGFVLFMDFIELLVAFLQAYVFTLLSALFIGMAVAEPEHN